MKPVCATIVGIAAFMRTAGIGRLAPIMSLSPDGQLPNAKRTINKDFRQSRSDKQLSPMGRSVNNPKKRRRDRRESARSGHNDFGNRLTGTGPLRSQESALFNVEFALRTSHSWSAVTLEQGKRPVDGVVGDER